MKLAGSTWGASANTLRSSALVLCYAAAAAPLSGHALLTPVRSMCSWTLPCVSSLVPPFYTSPMASSALQHWTASHMKEGCHWQAGGENRQTWQLANPAWYPLAHHCYDWHPESRCGWTCNWPVDITSRWRHNWKSAQVVNSHLVCDPTIRQLGFDLPRQQWSLLNRFCTEQGHYQADFSFFGGR